MPLRALSEVERRRIKRLTAESIDVTSLQPTRTGLDKAILDATTPVRNFLRHHRLHDYDSQGLGASEHGQKLDAFLLSEDAASQSIASLYRPKTKKGDPRIWFKGLPGYAGANDMLAIAALDGKLFVLNLSRVDIERLLDVTQSGATYEILREVSNIATSVADELLDKIRRIAAGGPVPSIMDQRADTAIGRTLEHPEVFGIHKSCYF